MRKQPDQSQIPSVTALMDVSYDNRIAGLVQSSPCWRRTSNKLYHYCQRPCLHLVNGYGARAGKKWKDSEAFSAFTTLLIAHRKTQCSSFSTGKEVKEPSLQDVVKRVKTKTSNFYAVMTTWIKNILYKL